MYFSWVYLNTTQKDTSRYKGHTCRLCGDYKEAQRWLDGRVSLMVLMFYPQMSGAAWLALAVPEERTAASRMP
jgi:hypothetical protein